MVALAMLLTVGPVGSAILFGKGLSWRAVILLGLPGMMIGAVGTILGWVAWARIRSARGRLTGMPMAVFASLCMPVLGLMGLVAVAMWVRVAPDPRTAVTFSEGASKAPATWKVGYEPVGGTLRLPQGMVATVEIVRGDQDPKVSIPDFVGYVLAPTANGGRATFRLEPHGEASGRWAMQMVSEDGAMAHVGFADLGPLTLASTPPMSLTVDVTEGMDQEILLTRPEAPGGTRRIALNVRVRGYRRTDPQLLVYTTVGAGSLPPAVLGKGGK